MIHRFQPSVGAEELHAIGEGSRLHLAGIRPRNQTFEKNTTSGLGLAMERLDLSHRDVVLPLVNCVSNTSTVSVTRARPVFCDVDARTLNPSVVHLADTLTPRVKTAAVLHYAGYLGGIVANSAERSEREIPIEDAACWVGSSVRGKACETIGDIGIWSLDPRKIITPGTAA